MMSDALLAECKYSDCQGDIGIADVKRVQAIPKAPHHIALVAICPECDRAGQYVVERTMIEDAGGLVLNNGPSREEAALRAAAIELDAIDGPDDLIALWDSLPHPPLLDGMAGHCQCGSCRRKRYA